MFNLIVSGASWGPNRDIFSRGRVFGCADLERAHEALIDITSVVHLAA